MKGTPRGETCYVLPARFWITANPATACAVLVRVFTDTLNVACLRGLNPFLPTLRGAPVTIEPHMQNASTFPPASATRPRKVVQFRYARPESGISQPFFSTCQVSRPPAPYRGQSGTSRKVAVYFSNFTPDAVRTSRYKGRAPRPIRWTLSLSPIRGRCPCPVDSAYYSSRAHDCQYVFRKIFRTVFFKDNENARARSGSQNRRKQAKTEVLNAEKFFEKIRKSAQKRFSPSCCTPIF